MLLCCFSLLYKKAGWCVSMISINATLVLQVIHFLILMFILDRLMFRPILKLVRERDGYIENSRKEIVDLQKKTDQLKEAYLEKEMSARQDASKERLELKNMGIEEIKGLFDQSREQVSAIRGDADRKAEAEISKTKPTLGGEAKILAGEIYERVIGRRMES